MDKRLSMYLDGEGHERREYAVSQASAYRAKDAAADAPKLGFRGHASVFGSRTWIGSPRWGFFEEIAETAFDTAIVEDDVRFLVNHDPNLLLARRKPGGVETLRLSKDAVGLATDADMADVSYARDLAVLLERGDLDSMSFAFLVRQGGEEWSEIEVEDKETGDVIVADLRTVTSAQLFDVAAVTYPAYRDTDASLRSAGLQELLEAERLGKQPRRRDSIDADERARLDVERLENDLYAAKYVV